MDISQEDVVNELVAIPVNNTPVRDNSAKTPDYSTMYNLTLELKKTKFTYTRKSSMPIVLYEEPFITKSVFVNETNDKIRFNEPKNIWFLQVTSRLLPDMRKLKGERKDEGKLSKDNQGTPFNMIVCEEVLKLQDDLMLHPEKPNTNVYWQVFLGFGIEGTNVNPELKLIRHFFATWLEALPSELRRISGPPSTRARCTSWPPFLIPAQLEMDLGLLAWCIRSMGI